MTARVLVALAALATACGLAAACGGTQKPAATTPQAACSGDALADPLLDFLAAGELIWARDTCAAGSSDKLAAGRDAYRTALANFRSAALDGACGPGAGGSLFPFEEILVAMDGVIAACRQEAGAASLLEASVALQQAIELAARPPG